MKIRFLGTSHGVPMPGRHYQSILIDTEKGGYIIDAGAPVMDILINDEYDLTKIKAIFATHMHGDHINGIPDIICLGTWYYTDMNFKLFLPEQRGIDSIREYCSMLMYKKEAPNRISYHLFEEGLVYDDGNVRITSFSTDHMDATSDIAYGFLVESEGKKIYITGDMHRTLKDFRNFLYEEKIDLLITECAHFSHEQLCEKIKHCKTECVAIIHVFPTDKYEKLKFLEKEMPFKMIYPNDGDVYEI